MLPTERKDLIIELAGARPEAQNITEVLPEFILWMNKGLGWSIPDIAAYYDVPINAVNLKLSEAKKRNILEFKDGTFIFSTYFDEDKLASLSNEEKVIHLQKLQDLHISGKTQITADQMRTLKDRLSDLRRIESENVQEGKEIIRLISFLLRDFFVLSKELYERSVKEAVKSYAQRISDKLWEVLLKKKLVNEIGYTYVKEELSDIITLMLNNANEDIDFNIYSVFERVSMSNPLIIEKINSYLDKHGKPKLVGGAVTHSKDAKSGGAQYRLKEKKETG
jgi:hypothetical protein